MQNIRQYVEKFHLVFLDQLGRKIDKKLCVLKGGCNLRFYFKSFRYSEDIDFDVHIINTITLRKKIDGILTSSALKSILQVDQIAIANISAPKQTTTTQRWKMALEIAALKLQAHTKIEFSRRGQHAGVLFEAIDSAITQAHHLPPIFLSHYDRTAAILQKIDALADRGITQARDIFDLYLLVGNSTNILEKILLTTKSKYVETQLAKALVNVGNINYSDFQSQVVAYLAAEYQEIYSAKEIWQQMVTSVKRWLQCN